MFSNNKNKDCFKQIKLLFGRLNNSHLLIGSFMEIDSNFGLYNYYKQFLFEKPMYQVFNL